MSSFTSWKHNRSVTGKVIISFLLVAVTFFLLWRINKVGFEKMLSTANSLSHPNPKLKLVNNIFRDVVYLDHLQRTQALQTTLDGYKPVLQASARLNAMLDTLKALSDTREQRQRIDSMKLILGKRDKLFLNYLNLRTDLLQNDTLTAQFRALSETFSSNGKSDSLLATEHKITTIVVEPADSQHLQQEEKSNFWDRLWGRKKASEAVKMQRLITEELNIKIDTLSLAKEDSALQKLGQLIEVAEQKRLNQRDVVLRKQRQLTVANNTLVSQLFAILQDIEREEIKRADINLSAATTVVNTGFNRMNTLLVVFIVGAFLLMILFFVDISKSKRYRAQLIEAKEDAEHLGQVKQRFLANMSHELRTPLQAIIGIAEQMKQNDTADSNQIDIVYHSSQHLLQTVNEVLDYSKIVSGSFRLKCHTFNMLELLAEVCSIAEVRATEKNLNFFYAPSIGDEAYYVGDPFRLKQILLNLLSNAIKFTGGGKVVLRVARQTTVKRAMFTFEVEDSGRGIAAKDLDNIFAQFEQGSLPHEQVYEGTGLGLSIVRELVQLHQGNIEVASAPGKGSVFTVRLSYAIAKNQTATSAADSEVIHATLNSEVWIVDDDVYMLELCKSYLEKYKTTYQLFTTPASLLQAIPASDPAIIMMDIRMPGMSGFELLRSLKKRSINAKFIALTAQVLPEERDELRQQGFDDFLLKPFQEREFFDTIQRHVIKLALIPADFDDLAKPELQEVFLEAMKDDLESLRSNIINANTASAAEYLHRLAGRTAQFELKQLAREFRKFELAVRNGVAFSTIEPDLERLIDLSEELMKKYGQSV